MAGIVILQGNLIPIVDALHILSGTVKLASVGIERSILIYRNDDFTYSYETRSAPDGTWSVEVNGSLNDRFTVVAVGEGGENDQVFAGIVIG